MTDGTETTDELLRKIGKELEHIKYHTARGSNTLAWMLFITIANAVLAAMWLFGVIEVEASGNPFG